MKTLTGSERIDATADQLWCELLEFGAAWMAKRADDLTDTCLGLQDPVVIGTRGWIGPGQIDGEAVLVRHLLLEAAGAKIIRNPEFEVYDVDASFGFKDRRVSIEVKAGFGDLALTPDNIATINSNPGDWWLWVMGYGTQDPAMDWAAHLRSSWRDTSFKLGGLAVRARPCSLVWNRERIPRSAVVGATQLKPTKSTL